MPMKRPALTTLLVLAGAFMAGCPIYDHPDIGCVLNRDCAPGYVCQQNSGSCVPLSYPNPPACFSPSDCASSETCTVDGRCASGDCTFHDSRCVSGYVCAQQDGAWRCIPSGAGGSAGAAGEAGASGS
jgi:hypothetical protein